MSLKAQRRGGSSEARSLTHLICGRADDPGGFLGAGDGAIELRGCIYWDGQENARNLSLSNVKHVSFIWVVASSTLNATLAGGR